MTNGLHRAFLIFEATLPNPDPDGGLAACLPVAQFWDALTGADGGIADLAAQLKSFYFTGLPGFEPVVRAQNYGIGGGTNTGQIRANLFFGDEGEEWQLREFRLSQKANGELIANNTFTRDAPFGGLVSGIDSKATTFQTEFLNQVKSLAATTVTGISMNTPTVDNEGQSNEQDLSFDSQSNEYQLQAGPTFETAIAAKLADLKITDLTASDILTRASTQACAGCHELQNNAFLGGGLNWPSSLGFVQQDERGNLSPALNQSFLPFRATVLVNFINQQCTGVDAGIDGDATLTAGGSQVGAAN